MSRASHLRLVEPASSRATVASDHAALDIDELFRELAPYVAAVGLRLLGRRDEVEDLVQDVFLDAHRAREKLRVHHEAKRWLTVVAVRKARRRLRVRRMRGWLHLGRREEPEDLAATGAKPEDRVFLGQLYAVLDRLPVQERVAWTLRHVQGEQVKTIADSLRCSLATAKRRIAAAQDKIAREMSR